MLSDLISEAHHQHKTITIYSDEPPLDMLERLSAHGVPITHRRLPAGTDPYVTIHEQGEFLGALQLDDLEELLSPPIVRPGSRADISPAYQGLFELLENTVFTALDRRQLLGASREVEDRAFRVGQGTLRVSFQSFSIFESQIPTYRHLAAESALDIHVYGEADWTPPDIDGITYHESAVDTIRGFWTVAFDGGGDEMQACALVAQEQDDEYTGFWTYDSDTVGDVLTSLRSLK